MQKHGGGYLQYLIAVSNEGALNKVLHGEALSHCPALYPFITLFWVEKVPLSNTFNLQMVPLSHT